MAQQTTPKTRAMVMSVGVRTRFRYETASLMEVVEREEVVEEAVGVTKREMPVYVSVAYGYNHIRERLHMTAPAARMTVAKMMYRERATRCVVKRWEGNLNLERMPISTWVMGRKGVCSWSQGVNKSLKESSREEMNE